MAKIEADKLELSPVEYNFRYLIQKVLAVIQFSVDEKQQKLTVNIDSKIPQYVIGDNQLLAQVLTNLLSNSIKFSPEYGKIQLDVIFIKETNGVCELRFEVADSGIGISPFEQKKLFSAFEQAGTRANRKFGGTGLGLAISKRIIEKMNGRIWVESELGKGAKFIFIVQILRSTKTADTGDEYKKPDDESGMNMPGGMFKGKQLLIAEDVEINREILIALLEDTGLQIDCAESGKEALDMIAADPEKYDIVLMDLQMPEMGGIEAARLIRALPKRRRKKLIIIALTANVFKDDINACLAAGMDDHLGKPLDYDKMMYMLRKYLLYAKHPEN
jgi:CheY-like chemotaxis protein/two-component sensor histidine kinase